MNKGLVMTANQARIERRAWDRDRQRFAATGEAVEGDVARLEQLADTLLTSSGLFLKGPVPWPWIVAAAALPGKALVVGLCLWRLAGAMKSRTVRLGNADLTPFGIGRATKSRALLALEGAGLVEVERQPGRFPRVKLNTLQPTSRRGAQSNSRNKSPGTR